MFRMDCGQPVSGAQKQAKSSDPILNGGMTPGSGGQTGRGVIPSFWKRSERFRDQTHMVVWPPVVVFYQSFFFERSFFLRSCGSR